MNNLQKTIRTVVNVFLTAFILSGCAETTVKSEQPGSLDGVKTVLVLGFYDAAAGHDSQGMVKCPLCGNYFESGEVPPDTIDRLTERTVDLLKQQNDVTVIVQERAPASNANFLPERQFITRAGKSAGADAVLTGYVYRYDHRAGTYLAAKNPASVALSIHMVRVADGVDIWSGYVDETQQALADDLFKAPAFFRHKGRWVSADEMADGGLEKIFKSFPKQ